MKQTNKIVTAFESVLYKREFKIINANTIHFCVDEFFDIHNIAFFILSNADDEGKACILRLFAWYITHILYFSSLGAYYHIEYIKESGQEIWFAMTAAEPSEKEKALRNQWIETFGVLSTSDIMSLFFCRMHDFVEKYSPDITMKKDMPRLLKEHLISRIAHVVARRLQKKDSCGTFGINNGEQ